MVIVDGIKKDNGRLSADIRVGSRRHSLFFGSALQFSEKSADALLLLALPAAMRTGGPLVIKTPVSGQLLTQIPAIQEIYRSWDSRLESIRVKAEPRREDAQKPRFSETRLAIAFTGGVDSFYSSIGNPGASLLFVHGLDVPLKNRDLRKRVGERLAWAASEMGSPFLEMETDLRGFSDRYMSWQLAYGGALAACALLLSNYLDEFGITAGQSLETSEPDGAHPALNALFSTEDVAVRTIGYEADRVSKVETIAAHPVVQSSLRVCWENRGDAYNCGVCEKCLRTMTALKIFGALEDYSTFSIPLDYRRLSRAVAHDPTLEMFTRENLRAAFVNNADPGLIRSLEKSLDPGRSRLLRFLNRGLPRKLHDGLYRVIHRRQADD